MADIDPTPTPEPTSEPDPGAPPPASPPADSVGLPPSSPDGADGAGGGTIGTSDGAPPPGQPAPATWPDDWRAQMAGDDTKELARLERVQSPADLYRSYRALEAKVSSGDLNTPKPEGDEEIATWREQQGLPADPDGYLESVPEGLVFGDDDKPLLDGFLKSMHDSDAPPEIVHQALAWYKQLEQDKIADRAEEDAKIHTESEDTLRGEWGADYRGNVNGMHGLFLTHGTDGLMEQFFTARMDDGSMLGDHPDTLRFLTAISKEINPHGSITPNEGETIVQKVAEEKAQLELEMEDTKNVKYDYYKNPAKQARYRELLEMEDRVKARAK